MSTVTIPTLNLPAGTQGTLKVVARDGLNESNAVISGLSLANHSPAVEVLLPEAGAIFHQGEFIPFLSHAMDVDAPGQMADSVSWTSNLDGLISAEGDPPFSGGLPALNSVTPFLSIGTHVLTATACDSYAVCVSDSVTIVVSN